MERFPKLGRDEVAAEIDMPFELSSDDGDQITATITKSGAVSIRAIDPDKVADLESVVFEGFAPEEAQAITKSFWGWLWTKIKNAVHAVINAVTFNAGPLGTCRADVQVTHVDGIPVGGTVGISCRN